MARRKHPDSQVAIASSVKQSQDLVFGLTGAIGTNLTSVQEALSVSLREMGYETHVIRLSTLLHELPGTPWSDLPNESAKDFYDKHIKAGNELRKKLGAPEAMALLAMSAMRDVRKKLIRQGKGQKLAFVLHSLKRSEEVHLLRKVYGSSFIAISAYSPRSKRVERLTRILAERSSSNKIIAFKPEAEQLVQRDENEPEDFGQDLRKTYPLSDFFVNVSNPDRLLKEVTRFTQLLFGHPWHTPTKDEQAMSVAQLASCRSASPARQVGAALTDEDGSILSIGCNDVAKMGGGLYWDEAESDGRDFRHTTRDTSDAMKENLVADILFRLGEQKLFKAETPTVHDLLYGKKSNMRDAQVLSTIDFVRAVHAEMNAILDATSRGLRIKGAVLYTTTFPCHDCAKHTVAAGILRVVYIEPYPKSLVAELFPDSIVVDSDSHGADRVHFESFEGVAPRRYNELFSIGLRKRKMARGDFAVWDPLKAIPQISERYSQMWAHVAETDAIRGFISLKKTLEA